MARFKLADEAIPVRVVNVDQLIVGKEMTRIGAAGSRFSSEQ